ncbi:hypothetical protein HYD_5800 [Candidatus Hydrogenosomobacter endosymbioticus]|uniref:Uncharacterized protein n=1 Tax=Candidatus Hydrogenosomobacter endosymbioticus TaxID=2558174 RepID=A0ABM7V9H2_9PROT|nr:hypothetical protein HYD_5800 [Candidatus Hydrogenosomobacter endosymbioticus]
MNNAIYKPTDRTFKNTQTQATLARVSIFHATDIPTEIRLATLNVEPYAAAQSVSVYERN